MFYSFKNSKVLLNNSGVLANSAEISLASANTPIYKVEDRHAGSFSADWGIGGSLRLNYLLTGRDFVKDFTSNETTPISGYFGGVYFNSGFLTSYSLNATPNSPPTINVEISFFDELKGVFAPTYEKADFKKFLSFSDAVFTDVSGGVLASGNAITSLNYSFLSQVEPVYLLGETVPSRVVFGPKEIRTRLETDILSGDLPISGKPVITNFRFRHPDYPGETEIFRTDGILYQREIGTSVGRVLASTLSIRQNKVEDPVEITSVTPTTAVPGARVAIAGTNLQKTVKVYYGDTEDTSFVVVDDTGVQSIVPSGAITGPLQLRTWQGNVFAASSFTVTQPSISVSTISPITGAIGDLIRISGDQFYRVDSVVFNSGVSGRFSVVSPAIIEAEVPYGAAHGIIRVGSTERGVTGQSVGLFVPQPRIEAFSPVSGLTGIVVSVSGVGFSGVTAVSVNNIQAAFSIVQNTGINITIPSGNTKGKIRVTGASGLLGVSVTDYTPFAHITSISPASGRTGISISVLGENFQTSNILSLETNKYMVGFQGASGAFTRVNSQRLDGTVPSGAKSGAVFIYGPDYSSYPSTVTFTLLHDDPTLGAAVPNSGKKSDYINLEGTGFVNVRELHLTGNATGVILTSASLTVSTFEDVISFQIPTTITGGNYDVIVRTRDGAVTGSQLLTVLDKPHISGFSPLSGILGQPIRLSGLRFYPDTKVYHNTTGTQCAIHSGSLSAGFDSLTFFVPQTPNSTGFILVDNGVDIITGADFRVIFKPEISGFTGVSGAWGDRIQISGLNLDNTISVFVGNTQATNVSAVSSTGLFFTIGQSSTTDFIYVSGSGGLSQSALPLAVAVPPAIISGFTPQALRVNKETLLISGQYFSTVNTVYFSGNNTRIAVTGDFITGVGTTGIRLLVPVFTTGGPIQVENDSFLTQSTQQLVISPLPALTGFGPTSGIFGQTVEATGFGFSADTQFYFPSFTGLLVKANNITIVSATKASFTVPREIIGGSLIVSGSGDLISSSGTFTPLPTISGFSPTGVGSTGYIYISGINATEILPIIGITGENECVNLIDTSTFTIDKSRFLNEPGTVTGFSVISAKVNDNFIGSGRLFLITSGDYVRTDLLGVTGSETFKQFSSVIFPTFVQVSGIPSVSGFNILSGNFHTRLEISGRNLSRVTGISFTDQTTITTGQIISQNRSVVSGTPPPSLLSGSGVITLLSRYGNAASTQFFTFFPALTISGFSPSQGPSGTQFTISGVAQARVSGVFLSGNYNTFQATFLHTTSGLIVTVPDVSDLIQRAYKVELRSSANNILSSDSFTIVYGNTDLYGNVTIHSGGAAATGLTVLSTGNESGALFYSIMSGGFLILNCRIHNTDWRCLSHRL